MPSPRSAPPMAPRGPLPARVYWFRRLVVLGVAVLLVAGLARLLGGSSDGSSDEDPQATTAGVTTSTSVDPAEAGATQGPTAAPAERPRRPRKKQTPTEEPLAEPTGACENGDIVATPVLTEATGGSDVAIPVNLRTRVTEACTWTVSAETLTVSITSGSDAIWSSRECPAAILPQDVVVRQVVDTPVVVTWQDAKRSDEECSGLTEWARLGWYHVEAAALGGESTDVQFELIAPVSEVITKTVTPKPQKGSGADRDSTHAPGEDGAGNSAG